MKTGQQVICINKYGWMSEMLMQPCRGPRYKEICTICGFDGDNLLLEGYPDDEGYLRSVFRPLQDIEEMLSNVLKKEILEPV